MGLCGLGFWFFSYSNSLTSSKVDASQLYISRLKLLSSNLEVSSYPHCISRILKLRHLTQHRLALQKVKAKYMLKSMLCLPFSLMCLSDNDYLLPNFHMLNLCESTQQAFCYPQPTSVLIFLIFVEGVEHKATHSGFENITFA